MSKTQTATEMLRQLSADEIRKRLSELEAEQKALRTLLQAAIRIGKGKLPSEVSK